jgi:hypothetical protein
MESGAGVQCANCHEVEKHGNFVARFGVTHGLTCMAALLTAHDREEHKEPVLADDVVDAEREGNMVNYKLV